MRKSKLPWSINNQVDLWVGMSWFDKICEILFQLMVGLLMCSPLAAIIWAFYMFITGKL